MESKAGSVLLLIGGILTSLACLVFLVLTIMAIFSEPEEGSKIGGIILFSFIFIVLLVAAILKFWASKLMKDPYTTTKGGIIGLVIGVIGGFDLLSIIGGIIGIVKGNE